MQKFFKNKEHEYEIYRQGGGVISWDYSGNFPVVDDNGNAMYERSVEGCENVDLLKGFGIWD
jgi:hypothetical protein